MQSQSSFHIAIIPDGNGRWACQRGLPRAAGHAEGARRIAALSPAARSLGVTTLTLFAFSSDNWRRPREEVGALMTLFDDYLRREARALADNGTQLSFIGRRDRLDPRLAARMEAAEAMTAGNTALRLRIAIDYSARDEITRAAAEASGGDRRRERFAQILACPEDDAGIGFMLRTQHNTRIHAAAAALALVTGHMLDITAEDWRWIAAVIFWVWFAEGVNTAFEHLCDAVRPDFNLSVQRAKDVAAGAVLILSIGAAVMGLMIFAPYLASHAASHVTHGASDGTAPVAEYLTSLYDFFLEAGFLKDYVPFQQAA